MPMSEKNIIKYITDAIPDADVVLEDLKGDGDHYSATVKSKSFLGKTRVEQHKMVYDAFKGKMGSELHALKLKTISE
jgi:stress-induced morphogen|tara:strand:+ start:155 stop:385 length:231 start_codon:yes stop_codon:yes gene_type:complete